MKLKEGFVLRTICGKKVLSGEGLDQVNYSKLLSLNDSAAYLWKSLHGKEFTASDMAKLLTDKYEVDEATAIADSNKLCKKWVEAGILE
jgi:hypothetical protein